ncbi:MAG: AAA family ATPase [Fusobacteriales bacterium]|nr:AAA family ATPase [Fusobacteriales bacterium]
MKILKINNVEDILDLVQLRRDIKEAAQNHDVTVIRVIGGILYPLKEEYNLLNLMIEYRKESEVIVVAENREGILNHVYLIIDVLHRNNINVKEVIYVNKNIENTEETANISRVLQRLKIPFRYL